MGTITPTVRDSFQTGIYQSIAGGAMNASFWKSSHISLALLDKERRAPRTRKPEHPKQRLSYGKCEEEMAVCPI
jgi:hypothetical protein